MPEQPLDFPDERREGQVAFPTHPQPGRGVCCDLTVEVSVVQLDPPFIDLDRHAELSGRRGRAAQRTGDDARRGPRRGRHVASLPPPESIQRRVSTTQDQAMSVGIGLAVAHEEQHGRVAYHAPVASSTAVVEVGSEVAIGHTHQSDR